MRHSSRLRRALLAGLTLVVGLDTAAVALGASPAAAATTLVVSTPNDSGATAGACGNASTTPPSSLSLREALCLADNLGGAVTIIVPPGRYELANGELRAGRAPAQSITISGAGSASTTIDGNNASRVLELDPAIVGGVIASVSGVTITGGRDNTFGGAGILAGSLGASVADSLTVTDSVITNNAATGTSQPGGGIQMMGGKLTLTNVTISNNSSNIEGSGVYYEAYGSAAPESLTVTGSTFSANSVLNTFGSGASGGALALHGPSGTSYSVIASRFVNNTANSNGALIGAGAAIYQPSGTLTANQNTFTGNSVTGGGSKGSAVYSTGTATLHLNRITGNVGSGAVVTTGSLDAAANWWGCNTGPNTPGCDTTSGAVTTPSYLKLTATASPQHVVGPDGTATITASLTTDSLGATVGGSNLAAFDTLPVTFVDPPGDATVTAATGDHTAALSSGVASIDYHSNTAVGPDPVAVRLDNATVSAALDVSRAPLITSPTTANFDLGDATTFTITTSGYPTAAITRTGTLPTGLGFVDNGDGTATISGTPTGGGGTYPLTITASNGTLPNAIQGITITVGQQAEFTSPATATFVVGSPGSFAVTTSGIPTVSSITVSGTLPPGVSVTDNVAGTVTLSGTPTGSGGTYPVTLYASNGITTAVQILLIEVDKAPAVTSNPSGQTVQPGTSVSFVAAASGAPAPSVQWQRSVDGGATFANIPGASSAVYTFTAAGADDGTRYRAVFTNVAGSATTTAAILQVGTAPAFTSADHGTFVVGQAGSFTVTTSGLPEATLSLSGTAIPGWLTLTDHADGTGTLAGTPPAGSGGVYAFKLRAANGFSPSAVQGFMLEVHESPRITSPDHHAFTAGQAGTFLVTASAGYPVATELVRTGALPSGVTFTDNGDGTAALVGTPATGTGGSYPITIRASATGGLAGAASQSFTLTVQEPPSISSADHATFATGTSGSFTVTTSPGTPRATVLSEAGGLPSGVSFTDNGDGTATLAGTPAAGAGGAYPLTITASNGIAPDATQILVLTVNQPPMITSADHVRFRRDVAGAFLVTTLYAVPDAVTLTRAGQLPPGMIFTDNQDGTATIAGTPTAAGVYDVTVTATNGTLPDATQHLTLTVEAPAAFTSADHVTFQAGRPDTFTVTTAAGQPTATALTEAGSLPAGVTFTDNGDGTATLAGTPAAGAGGAYPLTITASNGIAPVPTETFTLTVREPASITSADHATFTRGQASAFKITTRPGEPAAVTLTQTGQLPSGMIFTDNQDGTATVAGIPTAAGVYDVTVTATNGTLPDATQHLTLTVEAPAAFTSADHAVFRAGQPGSFTVTTAAGQPAQVGLAETGALPDGVSFRDNGDGTATIAGTPAPGSGGVYVLTLGADNGVGPAPRQSFTLTVREPSGITSADHATFLRGQPSSFTFTTGGGQPSGVTLSVLGALPPGTAFADGGDGTATLAGVPTAGGVYTFTVIADNGVAPNATQSFTATVEAPPVFTSADHVTFQAGRPDTFTVTTAAGQPTATALTEAGSLPAGVTFTDNGDGTATLSGTPAPGAGGVYPLVLTADNGVAAAPTQAFTVTVTEVPAITSPDHEAMTIGTPMTFTVRAAGYPVSSITATGVLPDGLALIDNGDGTATISGTPRAGAAGDHVIHVVADNALGSPADQVLTLTVRKIAQTVTVTSGAPSSGVVGGGYRPTGEADSGLPVSVSIDGSTTGSACSLRSGVVAFEHPGTCVVAFTQPGDDTYAAATTVLLPIPVGSTATITSVSPSASQAIFGQTVRATATVTAGGGAPAGAVQFAVDGTAVGAPVPVVGGRATSDDLAGAGAPRHPGAHVVSAAFVPEDQNFFSVSTGTTTFAVSQAATTTVLQVTPEAVTATVSPVAPGSGTPTGQIVLDVDGQEVATASLVGGAATLDYVVPVGSAREVSVTYSGDVDFTGSSVSTSRHDPVITAVVRSAHHRTSFGWYRSAVTVRFECTEGGAPLTTPCPSPVVLRRDGAGQSVTRTVTAADGGVATVVVSGIDIDRKRPHLRLAGVRNGAVYGGGRQPDARCVARDGLSGIASCRITRHREGKVIRLVARAEDKAGNVRIVRKRYQVR